MLVLAGAMVLVALTPHAAWAWTPGTHVFLGDAVLRSIALLPATVADLLRAFPHEFLYGSIAADTSGRLKTDTCTFMWAPHTG